MNTEHPPSTETLPIGSWAFNQEHRKPVRILESQTIWNHTSYLDRLITSKDDPDGSISSAEIERIARKHILLEDDE